MTAHQDRSDSPDDRTRWESRYAESRPDERPPSEFVAAQVEQLRGIVLDVAAGSGRNALYLARRGARVEAIDLAWNGLRLL